MRPDEARTILRAFRPKPWPTDRAAAVDRHRPDAARSRRLRRVAERRPARTKARARLTERLRKFDGLQVVLPDQATTPLLLLPPVAEGRDLKVQALRPAADGPRKIAVQASDEGGRIVARIELDFAATATKGEGVLPTPPELRNRMARLDIETQGGAGTRRAARRAPSPPARRRPGRAADRHRPAAAAGGLLPRARARSLRQPDHRRSRDGADPQHRRAADPRRRRALGQRPRGDRQVDRARRHRRALRRPQPRRGQRPAGADARCGWATARWAAS